jgi:SAM-dependent methyltransferase
MITLHSLRFMQSSAGAELLSHLETVDLAEANTLKLLTELRKEYSADNAAAALETARLRYRAREKFSRDTRQWFLTREALEQASNETVSLLRASWFEGYSTVADLGCSVGSDTIAMAEYYHVVAVDRDPVRLAMAQANLTAVGSGDSVSFIQADLTHPLPFTGVPAAFFDPARRTAGKRVFSVHDYTPPLDVISAWHFEALMVKLSPGIDIRELAPFNGSLRFISLNGELKEALLCLGTVDVGRQANVLSDGDATSLLVLKDEALTAPSVRPPTGYLFEPDPAVIRSGLFGELAQCLGLQMYRLDETIAYLTAETFTESPLARAWLIEDWMPFNLKKLRAYLREHHIGRVTVKKRGSPLTPEELIARLRLPGDGDERVVVLTRVMGQPAVLICQPR